MNYRCLFLLGTAIALAGCAKEPVPAVVPEDPNLIPLNIDGSINQIQTKVNAAGFVDKDALGLFAVNYSEENTVAGTLADNGNQADNVKYVFDEAANKWTPTKKVYYKDVNTNVDLYLYYPHQSSVTEVNAANFEVQKDQSSAATASSLSGYEASDFLWGKAVNITPSENKVAVQLSHKMAAVNVILVEKDGFAEGEFASLEKGIILTNTTRKAKINFATGEVSALGNAQQDGIVMCPQSSGAFRAVVVPQIVEAGEKLFAITIDGVSYGFRNSAASVTYAAGKQTDVTINIKKKTPAGEYELTLGDIKIADWTEDKNTHGGEARQYFVVNLTEAGTLGKVIRSFKKNPDKIRNLKVSGQITTEDFYFMRDSMAILEAINLKEAKVVNAKYDNSGKTQDDIIPYEEFNNKNTLFHFSFPETITYIGSYAFYHTSILGALIIPDDVTEIGRNAFDKTSIGSVAFPPQLKKIGESAFSECASLSGTLTLPESLISIGDYAFDHCSFTGELYLPNSLEYIGSGAFSQAGFFVGGLRIPDKITKLYGDTFNIDAKEAFTGKLDLNNAVEFGGREFRACHFTGELVIPNGTIKIPDEFMILFGGLGLSKVVFPPSLKMIGKNAFQYQNRICDGLVFPEGLVSIEDDAFSGCSIPSIELPSTIHTINQRAFYNCTSLSSTISHAVEPPSVMSRAFDGVAKDNFTVEVPAQSVTRYKTESGWSDFRRIAAHYDFSVSRDRVRTLNAAESRTLTLRAPANFNWSIERKPDWVTVTPSSGTGKAEITVSVDQMSRTSDKFEVSEDYTNYAGRSGEIVFRLEDKDYTCTLDVEQYDADYSDGEVMTLNTATKGPGIDIVFIGDGYDAKDIAKGTFKQNTEDGFKHFFGIEPYSTYKDYFNVYAVVSKSDDSGIGTVNTVIDTKFGSYFTQNRIKSPDADKCFQWAKRADASMDLSKSLVIMLMNTSTYEGVTMMYGDGSAIACCPVSTDAYPYDFRGIIQHEAGGHGFGKLGDEYIYHNAFIQNCTCKCCENPKGDDDMSTSYGKYKAKGWIKNLSMTADAKQVPWAHLIYHKNYSDKVDMYEGGYMHTRGVYRSEATSCMNNNIPYYSAISRQAIVERIKAYAGEAFDFDDFVAKDSFEVGTKSLARDFDWTFGVNPNMFRANGDGPIYMGEHPNVK